MGNKGLYFYYCQIDLIDVALEVGERKFLELIDGISSVNF